MREEIRKKIENILFSQKLTIKLVGKRETQTIHSEDTVEKFVSLIQSQIQQREKEIIEKIKSKRSEFGKEYGEEGYSASYNSAIDDLIKEIERVKE